tara:strand:+ start:933 stop:1622 length:690 start_codon:yes stop_codon:yes gene_type:complete
MRFKEVSKLALPILVLFLTSCRDQKELKDSQSNNTDFFGSNLFQLQGESLQFKISVGVIIQQLNENLEKNASDSIINQILEDIYFDDQVYRDRMMKTRELDLWGMVARNDYINQKKVLLLLKYNETWPLGIQNNEKANMAVWLTVKHSKDIEFNNQITKHLKKAYFEDSVISNTYYASLFDNVQSMLPKGLYYGTTPFLKSNNLKEPERKSINFRRDSIQLPELDFNQK